MAWQNDSGGSPRTIRMILQYDGTRYLGWQTQPGGGTVQDEVEAVVSRILAQRVRVHGAGRTDRGVHAVGQVASFQTVNPMGVERLRRGANALLPEAVRVLQVDDAPEGFHARHSATAREYVYRVWRGDLCPPFQAPYAHLVRGGLDRPALEAAAAAVRGHHDFASFCAAESLGEHTGRTVTVSCWEEEGRLLRYRIRAGSFLHHMVRNLVGTMLQVGLGRRPPGDMSAILAARDRRAAGPTAPARGLFLERVYYEDAPGEPPATREGVFP